MTNEIAVEMKLVTDQKSKKAKASITLDTSHGELTIDRISVIHQDGKHPWVSFPTISFPDKERPGKYINLDIISPGRRLKKAISDVVLDKYATLINSDSPT